MSKRIASYQVLEEIATGGHATVYRVWDTRTGQTMALKVMHPHLSRDPAYLNRFRREASLASSLRHPNIVRIFEVGREGDSHFIAMEYLPMTLHHLLKARGSLPMDRAAGIALGVCRGLGAANDRGIVHRDVKPQNILLSADGTPKLTDFGIARAEELATMTRTGTVMGTPHYMAPEQARGEPPDIRSDVYSVGVILYQMVTGHPPFQGETSWEVIRQHIEEPPAPVREARPEVPEALAVTIGRCLEKDPSLRYQTPADLIASLERLGMQSTNGAAPDASSIEAALAGASAPDTSTLPAARSGITATLRDPRGRLAALAVIAALALVLLFPVGGLSAISGFISSGEREPRTVQPAPTPAPVAVASPPALVIVPPTPAPAAVGTPAPTASPVAGPAPLVAPGGVAKGLGPLALGTRATVVLAPEEARATGVLEVRVVAQADLPEATLAIGKPAAPVPEPAPGRVLAYLVIAVSGASEEALSAGEVDFLVPFSWVRESGLGADSIGLYSFSASWRKLPTRFFSQGLEGMTYRAQVPEGAWPSLFAVTGGAEPLPAPTPTSTPVATPEPLENAEALRHAGRGESDTPAFLVTSSPWRLDFRVAWSGRLSLEAVGEQGRKPLVDLEVRPGVDYETFMYAPTGAMFLRALRVPADAEWAVSVTDRPAVRPAFSPFDPPGTTFAYTAVGSADTPPFGVDSSPWLLRYQATWTGPLTLQAVGDGRVMTLLEGDVRAGTAYETYVYGLTGPIHLSVGSVPADGRWVFWVVGKPTLPIIGPPARARGLIFTYTATGRVSTSPFQAEASPWKLVYTTSWSGPFVLTGVADQGRHVLVDQDVAAGIVYETYIYGATGGLHLLAGRVPGDGTWSISITQAGERPLSLGPGSVFTFTGLGKVNSPPVELRAPWRLLFLASWSGTFSLQAGGKTVVSQRVVAGTLYSVSLTDVTGTVYFSAADAPPDRSWTVWVSREQGS